MRLIFPDEGLSQWLYFGVFQDPRYHLFVNDIVPDRDTVLADLTEAAWSGYASHSIGSGSWTIETPVAHIGMITAAAFAFGNTSGSPQDAYGYYVTDTSNTRLIAIARFDDAPATIPDGGSKIVFPIIADVSELAS